MRRDDRTPGQRVASKLLVIAVRRLKRWTQQEAADWWGCSLRQWKRYEAGARLPQPLLNRLSKEAPQLVRSLPDTPDSAYLARR